jgi:LEA14-like dessication related protein
MPVKTKYIVLGSLAVIVAGGVSYYKYAQNQLNFSIAGGSVGDVSNGVAQGTFTFKISNGTGIGFTLKALNLNIYVNNVFCGTVQQVAALSIPASGYSILPVTVTLDMSKLEYSAITDVLSLITGGGLAFLFQGYCTASVNLPLLSYFNINMPVNEPYQLIGG